MKVMNLAVVRNDVGEKVLHLNIFGVIAQGWADTVDAAAIAQALAENKDAVEIVQHINSIGGDMFDGIAIYNLVLGHGAPVTSIVEGLAASAASIIALAGKTIMKPGTMMMVHNPWTVAVGDATELRRVAADLDKARDSLVTIYRAKTGKDVAEMRALLAAETLMTAEQAKRQGFADEIEENDATEPAAPPEARGDDVVFRAVAFPRNRMPEAFMALVTPPSKTPAAPENQPPRPPEEPSIQASSTPPAPPLTREKLQATAPELFASLLEEGKRAGYEAGIAAERARLREIDELAIKGCDEMVHAAKYGEQPQAAPDLAVAVLKAGKQAAVDLLAARERESKEAAGVRQSGGERIDPAVQAANEKRLVAMIVGKPNQ